MRLRPRRMHLAPSLLWLAIVLGGCGDDGATSPPTDASTDAASDAAVARVDAGAIDASPLPPDLGCYTLPRTHVEILNACTTAESIDKTPVTPLLRPDGTLPPLP